MARSLSAAGDVHDVLSATWDQFDLENAFWSKPSATTKQARVHRVPLSRRALKLLQLTRSADEAGRFVFPGRSTDKPLTDIKKSWAAICKSAKLDGVRLHDLRHTYASHLVSSGSSLPIIGALLGHTQTQTTNRYAHLLDDPLRDATEQVPFLIKLTCLGLASTALQHDHVH
jgi:integrase